MTTYKLSYDHAASSYGQPVLIDEAGEPNGPADVGLWGLPQNFCGQVYARSPNPGELGTVYWSGWSASPDKMWLALLKASAEHPELTNVHVHDIGRVELT